MGNSILRMHSFDNVTNTDLEKDGWSNSSPAVTATVDSGSGPFGENTLKIVSTGNSRFYSCNWPVSGLNRITWGGYVKYVNTGNTALGTVDYLFRTFSSASQSNSIVGNGAGKIGVTIVGGTTTYGTTNFMSGEWIHLQVEAFIHPSTSTSGTIKVKVNGVDEITVTGNIGTAGGSFTSLRFGGLGNGTSYLANFWLADATDGTGTAWKGQGIIRGLWIDTEDTIELIPQSGTDNAAMVNETTLNEATYNSISTGALPAQDKFNADPMPDTPQQLVAVQVKAAFKKDASDGTAVIRGVIEDPGNSTDYTSTYAPTVTTTTQYAGFIWETEPSTGDLLTTLTGSEAKTFIDNAKYGVKISAS